MRSWYGKEVLPETDIYKGCKRGAGYQKFNIKGVFMDPEKDYQIITLKLKGTNWKENSKEIFVEFSLEDKVYPLKARYFCNLPLWMAQEKLLHKIIPGSKQFLHEYQEVLKKYPEYFL